jgi:hypothetical protein
MKQNGDFVMFTENHGGFLSTRQWADIAAQKPHLDLKLAPSILLLALNLVGSGPSDTIMRLSEAESCSYLLAPHCRKFHPHTTHRLAIIKDESPAELLLTGTALVNLNNAVHPLTRLEDIPQSHSHP